MKHTEGKWRINDLSLPASKLVNIEPGICQIHQRNRRNKYYSISQLDEETQANARLIAAAPMLLEACKDAYNTIMETCNGRKNCATPDEQVSLEMLRAAIEAAEGRTE